MLTAQRFQLSVLAGGEAERWPPISLNTWSPPIPCLSLPLPFSLSLSLPLPPPLSLATHPSPGEGADSSQRPSLSKRACYSAPSLWDRRKTHTHTHIYARTHKSADVHTHRTCFHKGLVHSTHPRTLSLSLARTHTHKYFFLCPRNTCTYKNF